LPKVKNNAKRKKVDDYELEDRIIDFVSTNPYSSASEIHKKVEEDANIFKVRRKLKEMVDKGILELEGVNKGVRYFIKQDVL